MGFSSIPYISIYEKTISKISLLSLIDTWRACKDKRYTLDMERVSTKRSQAKYLTNENIWHISKNAIIELVKIKVHESNDEIWCAALIYNFLLTNVTKYNNKEKNWQVQYPYLSKKIKLYYSSCVVPFDQDGKNTEKKVVVNGVYLGILSLSTINKDLLLSCVIKLIRDD